MAPNKPLIELAIGGHKVVAGGDDIVAWRHTPWIGYHATQDGFNCAGVLMSSVAGADVRVADMGSLAFLTVMCGIILEYGLTVFGLDALLRELGLIQRWELDYPIGQVQSTLGLSIIKWRGDLALGFNSLAQFSTGRNSKVAVRAGINNKMSGLIKISASKRVLMMIRPGLGLYRDRTPLQACASSVRQEKMNG
nr:translocase of chloroplast 159, chloroplastic [Tanacetum cinerariifolium]